MPVETQKLFSLWDSIKLDNFDDVGEIGVNSSGTTGPADGVHGRGNSESFRFWDLLK